MLDYGSGDGNQYFTYKLNEYINMPALYCYDPAIDKFSKKPNLKFDIVINTDVLEHIPEFDLENVVTEIFNYSIKAIYFRIATSLAMTLLPNGDNAHCTLKTHDEWVSYIKNIKSKTKSNSITIVDTWGQSQGYTII
jgi:hypothetical protein